MMFQKDNKPINTCNICGEATEYVAPVPKNNPIGYLRLHRPCKCERETAEAERIFDEHNKKMERARDIVDAGYLDEKYALPSFDKDDGRNEEQTAFFKLYCENWKDNKADNIGFYLFGSTDMGKTYLACSVANYIRIEVGDYVLCGKSTDYISEMLNDYGKNASTLLYKVRRYPLMVVDDLGTEINNERNMSALEQIIDARYRAGKPLIITSNFTPKQLYSNGGELEDRIKSRISGMCKPKKIEGPNRRKDQFEERYSGSAMAEQFEWSNK